MEKIDDNYLCEENVDVVFSYLTETRSMVQVQRK
jgi:hypothetical protein